MMRPTVGVKPQQRVVLYSDAPIGFGVSVGAKSTTGYVKVTWWDSTTRLLSKEVYVNGVKAANTDFKHQTDPRLYAVKYCDTAGTKKIIVESTDANGNVSGSLIYFICKKRRKESAKAPENYCNQLSPNQQINKIDVSTCTNLKALICDRNNLTDLGDIKACKNLSTLSCSGNSFSSLDVSKIPNLEQLYCNVNYNLTNLTVGTNLKILCASSCGFTGFSPPIGSQLKKILMKDSALVGITLNNCTNLVAASFNSQYNDPGAGSGKECIRRNTPALASITAQNLNKLWRLLVNERFDTNQISLCYGYPLQYINLQNSGATNGYSAQSVGDVSLLTPGPKENSEFNFTSYQPGLGQGHDLIYAQLNTISQPIPIIFDGSSSFSTSTPSIATAKGWSVIGSDCFDPIEEG